MYKGILRKPSEWRLGGLCFSWAGDKYRLHITCEVTLGHETKLGW